MFEQLFEGAQALAHQRAGPLLEDRLRYLNHLSTQAASCPYLRHTAYYLLTVATCGSGNEGQGVGQLRSQGGRGEEALARR